MKRSAMPPRASALPRASAKPKKRAAPKPKKKPARPVLPGAPPRPKARGGMYGSGWRGEATWMHSLFIRARDGRCVNCGATERLQCAHICSRRFNATRTAEDNAICLCSGCHIRFTNNSVAWAIFLARIKSMDELRDLEVRRANVAGTTFREPFWYGEYCRLKAGLERIQGANADV